MEWNWRWGDKNSAAMFKAVYEDTGKPHPAQLTEPELRSDGIPYLDAYRLLSSGRVYNEVGPQAIPLTEIQAYTQLAGLEDPATRLKYARTVRRLDQTELSMLYAKREQKR